jgi:hypothetical protein
MNVTRTVTTTESITTPVNNIGNSSNSLLDNNNSNHALPPRYSNNSNNSLLDKGKEKIIESIGIFTESNSPIRNITPKSSISSINSSSSSNKAVEESSLFTITIKTPLIEALEQNLRDKNELLEQIRLLKVKGLYIDKDNKEIYEELLNLIREYNTKFDNIPVSMFQTMIETEQIDIRDPSL